MSLTLDLRVSAGEQGFPLTPHVDRSPSEAWPVAGVDPRVRRRKSKMETVFVVIRLVRKFWA